MAPGIAEKTPPWRGAGFVRVGTSAGLYIGDHPGNLTAIDFFGVLVQGPYGKERAMAAKIGGGGGSKFDLGQNSDMNVTPFVDVMLVLLIIFMVVAPLATVSIRLDLPPAKAPPPSAHDKPPTFISIQDSGQIFVSMGKSSMKQSSLDGLASDLPVSLAVGNPTNERIFIRADRHVRYRQFMDVINQLQRDGYYKIGLISEDLGNG